MFSPNEIKMFKTLGETEQGLKAYQNNETQLYYVWCVKCFCENIESESVNALRRGLNAIRQCDPCRNTPEFERLINDSFSD